MSLELPKRLRRPALGVLLGSAVLLLSACGPDKDTWKRVAMPAPRSVEGPSMLHLWQNAWIVALITGVIVWALIFWAVFYYRRRADDEIPVQTRYNLPIEIFYTLAPVMMVIVFFFFTIKAQDASLHDFDAKNPADMTVTVVGQQWSWTFNYNLTRNPDFKQGASGQPAAYIQAPSTLGANPVVFDAGTTANRPTLWLPLGKKVEFHLYSPDVIHSFWATDFLFKMDVVPGRDNHFGIQPNRLGTFEGRCAELCGVYHSRMLFDVKVVTPEEFAAHLQQLAKQGNTGPALGGGAVLEQPGLETTGGAK